METPGQFSVAINIDNFISPDDATKVVGNAFELLDAARAAQLTIIHVGVIFRSGYPEISPRNKVFTWLKDNDMVVPGGKASQFHTDLTPRPYEPVVAKHRMGSFTGTDLERLLRAKNIDTLLLAGVTTTGVVLSTARQAFDLDYDVVIASDCCADSDKEAHVAVLERILPHQTTIIKNHKIFEALQSEKD